MLIMKWIGKNERGLYFRNGALTELLGPGLHVRPALAPRTRIEVVSTDEVCLKHAALKEIVRSGKLDHEAEVLELKEYERAIVWIDGSFNAIVGSGLCVLWKVSRKVEIEVVDARALRFEHESLWRISRWTGAGAFLDLVSIEPGFVGVHLINGRPVTTLEPGTYAFWKNVARSMVGLVDQREKSLDVNGQEIMTADKVTLRVNAVVAYRIADPVKVIAEVPEYAQSLYREAQLSLRGVIGSMELEPLLAGKESVTRELEGILKARAEALGLALVSFGIRDLILPGEMKSLLNKVIEAKKAAEAALITRREETASIRSQANTAKIIEDNPVLMRLRELEVLEKVSEKANLTVVMGEKGLAGHVTKMI